MNNQQQYPTIYNKDSDKTVRQLISIFEECHAIVSRDDDWRVDEYRKEATNRFVSGAKKAIAAREAQAVRDFAEKVKDITIYQPGLPKITGNSAFPVMQENIKGKLGDIHGKEIDHLASEYGKEKK